MRSKKTPEIETMRTKRKKTMPNVLNKNEKGSHRAAARFPKHQGGCKHRQLARSAPRNKPAPRNYTNPCMKYLFHRPLVGRGKHAGWDNQFTGNSRSILYSTVNSRYAIRAHTLEPVTPLLPPRAHILALRAPSFALVAPIVARRHPIFDRRGPLLPPPVNPASVFGAPDYSFWSPGYPFLSPGLSL